MNPLSNKGINDMNELDCMRAIVLQGGRAGLTNKGINQMNELDCLREMVLRSSGSVIPIDPLAGFTWAARLQTHNGDNVPLGLYQDTACTIPATEDFDPVAAIRGEFATGTITLVQATESQQGYLLFVNGIPTVQLDGVDDCYKATFTLNQPYDRFTVFANVSDPDNGHILLDGGSNDTAYLIFTAPNTLAINAGENLNTAATSFDWHATTEVFNGASSKFSVDNAAFATGPVGAANAGGATLGGRANQTNYFAEMQFVALAIPMAPLTDPQRAVVNTYLQSLQPPP